MKQEARSFCFSIYFLSQMPLSKGRMLKSNGCFQLHFLLRLLHVASRTAQIFANWIQHSFLSALGQPQWLPWHSHIIRVDGWQTAGKSWKARPAVLRTQWEILLVAFDLLKGILHLKFAWVKSVFLLPLRQNAAGAKERSWLKSHLCHVAALLQGNGIIVSS